MVGLGRFGQALAMELMGLGTEVLGVDRDEALVQKMSGVLTHAVCADSTDDEAMRQLGVDQFERVVVGIGSNLECSILTCSVMRVLGVRNLWAKAVSEPHARILRDIGCGHVVRPEHDTGRRVAHLIAGRMLDYIEFDDGYAIVKMRPPTCCHDMTLLEANIRQRFGVTIVGVKRAGEDFTHAVADTVIHPQDLIIVSGQKSRVERFAELNAPSD